ncbi:AAA family ATPase [Winogradskyella poriferorum]|uniref:AAA family ATPase n=1 Tax=Winogradskyella poriferorum TaxID=307627 RepID=A0ABU7W0H4_9FLAO
MNRNILNGNLRTELGEQLKSAKEQRLININHNEGLIIKTANQWLDKAKSTPIPNMLFSEFWYENELCILFADTNLGKSILAVQIAQSISSGVPIDGFKLESTPRKTLYLDFELSDKQFEKRYSEEYTNHFVFSENLLRAELNPYHELPKEFKSVEDYICTYIETCIKEHHVAVVIVDNMTYLKNDNEKAKDALDLMKKLNKIKKTYQISILVLAHTPKRDESKPISKNDISGSKMIVNFCDSAFAIGNSTEAANRRYLKQIKQRNIEHLYHGGNVVVCDINKDFNFLEFRFIDYDNELTHLKSYDKMGIEERDTEMVRLLNDGLSNVAIAEQLGVSEGTIRIRRKKLGI